jgi:hypothetical protein
MAATETIANDFEAELSAAESEAQSCPDPTPEPETDAKASDPVSRLASVSTMLRSLGAVLVVAATSTFMLQQWSDGSDVSRYLTLLALTTLLAGAGFVCGLGVRETRGARTFLALVIASVPVHFAVLGGLLQSQFPWDQAISASAPWNAGAPGTALMLAGVGVATLIPLTWLSMLALVRPHARGLTQAFILVNLPLLLPLREPNLVAWVIVGMFVLIAITERRMAALGYAMRTFEGRFVRSMMVVPAAIAIGRGVMWYEPTLLFCGLLVLSGGLACFDWVPRIRRDYVDARVFQGFSAGAAVLGWYFVSAAIYNAFSMTDELVILMFALPATALLMFLSTRCVGNGAPYRVTAILIAVGSVMVNLVYFWDPAHLSLAGFACLLVGIVTLAYGLYTRRIIPLGLGVVATLGGFTQLLVAAIEIEHLFHWGSLATLGIVLIFVAALCERYARRMLAYAGTVHHQMKKWDY